MVAVNDFESRRKKISFGKEARWTSKNEQTGGFHN